MSVLKNRRHEMYAQALATGISQVAAYKYAGYNPDKGAACRLAANPRVKARLNELLAKAAAKTVVDRAWILDKLAENARNCLAIDVVTIDKVKIVTHNPAAANKALELLGKEKGMFREQVQLDAKGGFSVSISKDP